VAVHDDKPCMYMAALSFVERGKETKARAKRKGLFHR
jgi:hypothetical protein